MGARSVVVLAMGASLTVAGPARAQPPDVQATREVTRLVLEAQTLNAQGRVTDAIQVYEKVLQANPRAVPALRDLAWIRATSRDASLRRPEDAVRLAESAFESMIVSFNSRPSHDAFPPDYDQVTIVQVGAALAASYAATGRFESPMDPFFAEEARQGRMTQQMARAQSDSTHVSAQTAATWGTEMARAVHQRRPFPQTRKLVADMEQLLTQVRARRPIDDGRPLPGTDVR